jgi:hypothetical protein
LGYRQALRVWYLWIKQIIHNALAKCSICGSFGVDSWSLHPAGMCARCDAAYQKALQRYGTTDKIETFLDVYGPEHFLQCFCEGWAPNPMAETQEKLEAEEEEIPNFDMFPGKPQICTRQLPHVCTVGGGPCNGYPNLDTDEATDGGVEGIITSWK